MQSNNSQSKESASDVTPIRLPALAEWMQSHIERIFEASSDTLCSDAVSDTFSLTLQATLNGRPMNFVDVANLSLALRKAGEENGGTGLKVHWKHVHGVPDDPNTNRDGSFGGVYTLSGIRMPVPGSTSIAEFERSKLIVVKIESQSADPTMDSRKICNLVSFASAMRVDA